MWKKMFSNNEIRLRFGSQHGSSLYPTSMTFSFSFVNSGTFGDFFSHINPIGMIILFYINFFDGGWYV